MIKEFAATNSDGAIVRKFYCETQEQASNKAKFLWPQAYIFVEIKPTGRTFKDLDDYINNH